MMTVAGWRHGDDPTEHIQATRRYWSTLERFTKGFYVNDMAREVNVQGTSMRTIVATYEKLAALKTKYDPDESVSPECERHSQESVTAGQTATVLG